ncbi:MULTISPECIES: peptide chain release factor 2 [unclassified Haematospirillum]|uniref:peptide chain release factor 2 n=1 Tax=unclassified Haematospirillum TaxID=2622088 RepID=UPI00143B0E53|nr:MULTISPECIES: peptide chain release factor 2 [unclassified Haematospirillum]NKD54781.1 peptide chain release factor 2 [Haematospirillum sp. H4890]NKD74619.1 peptide chain release factor 2 [Haematospirillum sp. H4485]
MRAEAQAMADEIKQAMALLRRHLDWDTAHLRLDELNALAENPALWDKPAEAQKVMQERTRLEQALTSFRKLEEEFEDACTLVELGESEGDEPTVEEGLAALRQVHAETEKRQLESLLSGEADANDAYLEINAGAGGTEAQDWANILMRMYTRWCEKHGYSVEILEESEGEEAGIKSVTLQVKGHNAYGWLKTESGVHRLVRISPFDSSARRHTSFSSVWVYPVVDDNIEIEIAESDCRIDTYRASGAGGQHVNRTESAVRITHIPTGVVVACQTQRSQHQNRDACWKMLKARLYELELQKREAASQAEQDAKTDIGWGHQIRSYVLQPYQMVKDLRTSLETSDTQGVLDGDLDPFMAASLAQKIKGYADTANSG